MNSALVSIGVILMIAGAVFTFITLGLGIICSWPLILVGFILLIVGVAVPEKETTPVQEQPSEQKVMDKSRYCPECGRAIPFDAKICPYCGKKF